MDLNPKVLEIAINRLIQRHEILRTVFIQDQGGIIQKILTPEEAIYLLNQSEAEVTPGTLSDIIVAEYNRKFDLTTFPLFFVKLYRTHENRITVLLTAHHIITDGHSQGVLQPELHALCSEIITGSKTGFSTLPFQYQDFTRWQKNFLESKEGVRHKEYWLHKLNGFSVGSTIPLIPSEKESNNGITVVTKDVDRLFFEQTSGFAKGNGLTLTSLHLGVLILLFEWLTDKSDLTICTNVSGRNSLHFGDLDISGLIGFFSNLLLVRNTVANDLTIDEFLQTVQANFLDDISHADYPIAKLITEIADQDASSFLEQAIFFNYHNYPHLKEVEYEVAPRDKKEIKWADLSPRLFTFGLSITEFQTTQRIEFLFNNRYFDEASRDNISRLYFLILGLTISSPEMSIKILQFTLPKFKK